MATASQAVLPVCVLMPHAVGPGASRSGKPDPCFLNPRLLSPSRAFSLRSRTRPAALSSPGSAATKGEARKRGPVARASGLSQSDPGVRSRDFLSSPNPNRRTDRQPGPSDAPRAVSAPPAEVLEGRREAQGSEGDGGDEEGAVGVPYEAREEEESAQGGGSAPFVWAKHWYPVALVEDLDPAVPSPFTLLGQDLVLWRDSQGIWRAHRDVCPHRLAPLSEGRIDDKTGDLQCSYHGWTFRGDGSCASIPQAAPSGPEARAAHSPRACVAAFPALVSQGLLFVWPEAGNWAEALASEPPRLPPQFEDSSRFSVVSIQRDLYYGYDVLMENVSDPSHINFAHHKVTGRRDRAQPLPFKVQHKGAQGFEAESDTDPKFYSSFQPPTVFFSKLELSPTLPLLGRQSWELWICSFIVPMGPGWTRSIVCSARNFARVTVPGEQWWALYPRWLEHLTSNKIYDGDMIVLQGQEKALHRMSPSTGGGSSEEASKPVSYNSMTFTPAGADLMVLAFRNWLRRFGGGGPAWDPSSVSPDAPLPSTVLSKREMLDRLSQHTHNCSSCRTAHSNFQRARVMLGALSAVFLAAAVVPSSPVLRAALAAASLLLLGISAYLKLVLLPQFEFVDYVHAHID